MLMSKLQRVVILTALIFFLKVQLSGMLIEDYESNSNDRFANSEEFIANNYNLSGIALSSNGRWVTMISPNVYVTADHFSPGTEATITFHATNDPNGPQITRQATSLSERFGESDLLVGVLNKPLPENFAFYPYASESFGTSPQSWNRYPYNGPTLLHFGRTPGSLSGILRVAVGQNKLSSRNNNIVILDPQSSGPAIVANRDDPSTNNFVHFETFGEIGDSGGPLMFPVNDTELRLVGLAWFITNSPDATGFTPIGHYSEHLDDFINSHGRGYLPATPTGLNGLPLSVNTILLQWDDHSSIETGYEIQRAETIDGPWIVISNEPPDTSNFTDSNLPSGTQFFYRLRAVGEEGFSDFSEVIFLMTPPVLSFEDFQIDTGLSFLTPEDKGPLGDPDKDGIPNLMEYALGGDPLVPNTANLPGFSYTESTVEVSFVRKRADIKYKILVSTDLDQWDIISTNPGNVGELVIISHEIEDSLTETVRTFIKVQMKQEAL